ncbi:MAG: WD40/YVTN/BNR-like repeat-containing protein [Bacteroidota bacterium]
MSLIHRLGALFVLLLLPTAFMSAQPLDMEKFKEIKPRSIGPAGMSGRVTAIDVVLRNTDIIYVGTASGGLWKSTSGGVAWEPVFDTMAVASIGAIAIDQRKPDVVWVGTGEGNPRNSQTNGNGVYKSLDGGWSWVHLGLDKTRNIHRVIISPENPDVVYVAALGAAWGEHPERGVFKTTDGGMTWQKILYVDEKTGAADLVMDPSNPNKLFAAMWEYRRWPWFFKSGGASSGLHVTVDGGKTWTKRSKDDGLPDGELGRIGLAIAPSDPAVIYALIESKKNALYRSDDGGVKWKMVADKNIGDRPFYYGEIHVDPQNENRVYNIHSVISISEDAGKTFSTLMAWSRVHPDHHAWWINRNDPNHLIDGNDGGLAISHDRGKTWRFVENLPLAQFYHIEVDSETPYNVYGGMQDNGSWRGPAYVWRHGGIRNTYWEEVAFGDGFDVIPDRSSSRHGYAMSQGGFLYRYDLVTGETKIIRPANPKDIYLRFNWNAGIAHDPFSPTTIYYGSQFLHKSTDRGNTWQSISPDLTTNDTAKQKQGESGGLTYDVTAAENHTTIIAIAPSTVQQGVIWVGTDDGNVQVTRDGGKSWKNVIGNMKGVPKATWVPQIRASTYDAGEAFVVFDNHRQNDWTPYVYRTKDYGATWIRLADEKKVWGFAHSIIQDPIEPKLMFLGTEFGLHVSIDAGENWTKWKHGYPTVSTVDLAIQPTEHDLVIGTFGRAAYVLDDIRPLRQIAKDGVKILGDTLRIFTPPDAILAEYKQASGTRFAAEAEFAGENRPYGALLTYLFTPDTSTAKPKDKESAKTDSTKKDSSIAKSDTVKIEIFNDRGELIRTLKEVAKRGMNRTTWGLERKGERFPTTEKPAADAAEPGGPATLPGKYKIRISNGRHMDSTFVQVKLDPRLNASNTEVTARNTFREAFLTRVKTATEAADRLRESKKTIEQISAVIKDREGDDIKKVKDTGKTMQDSLKVLMEMIAPKEAQGYVDDTGLLSERINLAWWYLNSSWEVPSENEQMVITEVTDKLKTVAGRINSFFEKEWTKYREAVDAAKISFFTPFTPITVE